MEKDNTIFMDWKNKHCEKKKMTILPRAIYRLNAIPNKITQKIPNSQNNLNKEQSCEPWFQTILQSYSNQNSMVLVYAEYIMRNTGLDEAQDCRRNINSLRYEDDTTLMAESEEELKSLLMKMKEL